MGSSTLLPSRLLDLELIHNFTSKTAATLSDHVPTQNYFATDFVELSLSHDFLLRGILGFSAFHKAYQARIANPQSPNEITKYLSAAEFHSHIALQSFRQILSKPTRENAEAFIGCTIMLFMTSLARPRESDSRESASEIPMIPSLEASSRILEWMNLIRNVTKLLHDPNFKLCFDDGPMDTALRQRHAILHPSEGVNSELIAQLHSLLEELDNLSKEEVSKGCLIPVTQLVYAFRHLGQSFNNILILGWPAVIPDEYFTLLESKNPEAWLVLAYYCALLKTIDHLWWIQGWPEYILKSVESVVGETWKPWLRWPSEIVSTP